MKSKPETIKELEIENARLRERLEEVESVLQAIQKGDVDAFVISKSGNAQIETLNGTDYLYRVLVESMNEGAVTLVPDGTIFYANHRFSEIMEQPVNELIGASFLEFIPSSKLNHNIIPTIFNEERSLRLESYLQSRNGKVVPVELSAHPLEAEDIKGLCIVVTDITERKQAHERLNYLSSHDILTGLYNRNFFEEEMARLEKGRHFPMSVLEIDIDKLKQTNDQFGHAAGDDLIKQVAKILREIFRADDIIARIGGDEFAVLLPDVDKVTASQLVTRIEECMANHNASRKGSQLMFSIGVATALKNEALSEVLKRADQQMYLNKQERNKLKV